MTGYQGDVISIQDMNIPIKVPLFLYLTVYRLLPRPFMDPNTNGLITRCYLVPRRKRRVLNLLKDKLVTVANG